MRPVILLIVVFSLMILSALCRAEPLSTDVALAKAVEYLWDQQAEDGSWRSPQYGVLRSGEALTPFVLHSLLLSMDNVSSEESDKVLLAARFILEHIDKEGAVGRSDPDILEYPVYSTAYAIECFRRIQAFRELLGPEGHGAIQKMQAFLVAAQYQEANGFSETDAPYGGWGFNAPVRPGVTAHMDIAHTRKALAALQTFGDKSVCEELRQRAEKFLWLVQKHPSALAVQPVPHGLDNPPTGPPPFDGGFYFSPVVLVANKAHYDHENYCWRSYATATCDGVLALLAAGVDQRDPRIVAAVDWLRGHTDVDYPQGVPTDHPEPWGDAVRFYHYSVRAEVYRKLDFPAQERARLAKTLIEHQRPDGSFVNTASPLMKEDDPVLCTAMAVVALASCTP